MPDTHDNLSLKPIPLVKGLLGGENTCIYLHLFKALAYNHQGRGQHCHLGGSRGARGVAGVALNPPDIGLATPGATPKMLIDI